MVKFMVWIAATAVPLVLAASVSAQEKKEFKLPTYEELTKEGFEAVTVVLGMAGPGLLIKKGNQLRLCKLDSYTFTHTGESFLKGVECVQIR